VLSELKYKIPLQWYPYIYPTYKKVCKRLDKIERALDRRTVPEAQFEAFLKDLGFQSGATVMVHSALSHIRRRLPGMTAERLIGMLQNLVGPNGTLLFPTFSFLGRQAVYVDQHDRFNVQNTPSQVGALTEVFRKMPGVVRSWHPTHSMAGWGRHAAELLSTHHLGPTFGMSSPFYRLGEFDGRVIGLGTRYRYGFSITHVAEEVVPEARALALEEEPRKMTIVNGSLEIPYEFQVFRAGVLRDYEHVEKIMLRENILRYAKISGLHCTTANAAAFLRRSLELAAQNNYILRAK
jgi:aminoglycoside 3-N-acetyltransferase